MKNFSFTSCQIEKSVLYYMSRFERATEKEDPGVAKFGIALEWGSRGRWFESSHSDQKPSVEIQTVSFLPFLERIPNVSEKKDVRDVF